MLRPFLACAFHVGGTFVRPQLQAGLPVPGRRFRLLHRNDQDPGLTGDSLRLRANFAFTNRVWISQPVTVMNVDELTRRFGTPVDGLLGQDVLREFRSVRINYKSHVVELEQ
jgi:hypothetical protein